jgi:aminoglycoside N3'-acetyltransferase
MSVTREQIVDSIRALGVRPGDLLITHSSFKSIRPVDGGPSAVAQALVDAVSPGGSAFVPTFNYGNDPYDPAAARSYDGVITEHFRKLPGAVRSLHPTHPIAGIGPDAAAILEGHDKVEPFGEGSPCWRLWERNAWVLLIGVSHESNSVAHVAEEHLQMTYLDRRRSARVVRGGAIEEVTLRRPGCSDAWAPVIDAPLRATHPIRDERIGSAHVMLMRSRDVVEATVQLLRSDPAALLCEKPTCEACQQARRMLRDRSP